MGLLRIYITDLLSHYTHVFSLVSDKCHIARMEDNAPCKKITFSQPEGNRKKGRPKLRCLDSILKDLKILKVTAWWRTTQDNLWSKIIKEAKAHKGL
jgi:hypothetical protein